MLRLRTISHTAHVSLEKFVNSKDMGHNDIKVFAYTNKVVQLYPHADVFDQRLLMFIRYSIQVSLVNVSALVNHLSIIQ